ncbi:MAG: pilus assembly protein TadG-related protein, partial [Acidimicrobiia bacterium]
MKAFFQKLKNKDERGAAIALVAASITLLMGMAAFGTDLAWFYLNASRIQRAADAGALAGVIWMPTDFTTASSTAHATTQRNGYEDTVDFAVVTPTQVVGEINQLRVTVTDTVDTFFIRLFGFQDMTITRTATAEFVPPLRLGSPDNQFGNTCDPGEPGCSGQANFWANIHGKWTDTRMGDAYSSYCDAGAGSDNPSCAQNPLARDSGYLYGV